MNKVQSMFGRHFSTAAGLEIEQATNLSGLNWNNKEEKTNQFTRVCRTIDSYSDGAKDAIKAFRKRLNGNKNFSQVELSVSLLEFCVKHLGVNFHLLIGRRDFAGDVLLTLLSSKSQYPSNIKQIVLGIIKMLAETYKHSNVEMSDVIAIYNDLLDQRYEFPKTNKLNVSLSGNEQNSYPSASSSTSLVRPAQQGKIIPPGQPIQVNQKQLLKLQKDLSVVEGNVKVFSDMLTHIDPVGGDQQDIQLMGELNRTCRSMQQRIVELISQVQNDDVVVELLRVNDELNNVFMRYDRFERYLNPQNPQQASETTNNTTTLPVVTTEPPPSYNDSENFTPAPAVTNDLIDLGIDTSVPEQPASNNELAFGDFSKLSLQAEPAADIEERVNNFSGNQSELDEVKEIESWLNSDKQFGGQQAEVDDFSSFLSQRATTSQPNQADVGNNSKVPNADLSSQSLL